MRRHAAATLTIVLIVIAAALDGREAAQTARFEPLFDGRTLSGWTVENTDAGNFSVRDGVLHVTGPGGWLRSVRQFADFALRVELRFLTADADSGIFLRAPDPPSHVFIRGWPANAYQVQARDISTNRTDKPIWIGNLYRHRVAEPGETDYDSDAALQAFRPTGEWQLLEIEAAGSTLTVALNGTQVTRAANIVNPRGHVGIQGETGAVEYRAIDIAER
jgi:N-sulfoglucosamine sulfohydrolase